MPSSAMIAGKIVSAIAAAVLMSIVSVSSRVTSERDQQESSSRLRYSQNLPDSSVNMIENEISNGWTLSKHKLHQNYVCGKPMLNNADSRLNNEIQGQNFVQGITRNKYRPTEIRMPRIIGGDETLPGEFPWTVSVKLNNQPICGGSLIHKSWVLTAAHCVVGYNPKNLTIRLGAYRIKDLNEAQTIELPINMFVIHKDYSMPRPFSNDIAMLKMSEPVEFSDYIIPICLPKEDRNNARAVPNLSPPSLTDSPGDPIRATEETGSIVVSTKMSDLDIAKCFTKLEQNYLNSIGLGTMYETTTLRPTSTQASKYQGLAENDLLLPIFASLHGGSMHGGNSDSVGDNNQVYNKDRPLFRGQSNDLSNLEPETVSVIANHLAKYGHEAQVLHDLPWTDKTSGQIGGAVRDMRRDTIKLSRLPISKELLHEIQSVGSGPMQTLGLQHGDFAAMANELSQQLSISNGATHERERVSNFKQLVARPNPVIEEDDPSKYGVGLSGTVIGWGWVREQDLEDKLNKGYPSITLQKVKLPILRNNVCEAWFQSQAKKITLLPSQFCAGFNSGGKDACRGDSGGPMVIEDEPNSGSYTLIGIVSAGIGCARPSLPGLYTRVASFLPWIEAQMVRY